jgi:hypothetical protein
LDSYFVPGALAIRLGPRSIEPWKRDVRAMLEKLPSVVTITTFAALCLAVSHEWAYYGVIGAEYQTLYTTSDYIALIIWGVGAVFFFLVIIGLFQFITYRADDFRFPPFSKEKTVRGFMDRNFYFVVLSLGTLLGFFFGTSQVNVWSYALLAFAVFRGLLYIFGHEKLRQYNSGWFSLLIYGLPSGMIILYGVGRTSAYTDIGNKDPHYELRLKDQYVSRDVDVLRFLEKGAVAFDPKTRTVEFVRNDMIVRVTRKTPELDNRSFICKHWEVGCATPKQTDAHNS